MHEIASLVPGSTRIQLSAEDAARYLGGAGCARLPWEDNSHTGRRNFVVNNALILHLFCPRHSSTRW